MKRCGQTGGLALVSLLVAACSPESVSCPNDSGGAPIVVEVRDASTGEAAAVGATGSIRSGSDVTPLYIPHSSEHLTLYPQGAHGRHGTYSVVVQKAGYRDWERNGVYVLGGDDCGGYAKTVTLRADLEPLP